MARSTTRQARYRLAATGPAVAGALLCLGAMFGRHVTTFIVVGAMNFALSMLLMSLSPQRETVREEDSTARVPCSRETECGERSETNDERDAKRPRERNKRTWSI